MGTTQSTHTNATEITFASASSTRSLEQGAGGNKEQSSIVSGRKTDENSHNMISNNKNRGVVVIDGVSIENTEVLENEEDSADAEWYDSDDTLCGTDEYEQDDFFGSDDEEEEEEDGWNKERLAILEDARNLSLMADFYHNPHKSVVTSDGAAMGRNYFDRPSAPAAESLEEAEERAQILADAAALMKIGVDYLLPELPVVFSDPAACGRNYFDRASATLQEEEDTMDEREDILEDLAQLKKLAQDYLQPERPVVVDALATCRNYFDRPSAPTLESLEEAEERAQILADAAALKKLAVDYLHPELPVVTSDPAACGRNYFDRASADGHEDMIVEDLHQWYDPPTEVPTLFSYIMANEQAQVLADAAALKQLAVDYLHPERPVKSTGAGAMGRNYFDRASAILQEEEDMMDEREDILEDLAQLKELAQDYLQPERPVVVDSLATCRNYFDRPSAPTLESLEEAEERAQILADADALKKLAVDYLHPELPVVTSDPAACGRNYFDRASAEGHEDMIVEDLHQWYDPPTEVPTLFSYIMAKEQAQVLADAAALKRLAVDYLHPERPVKSTGGGAMGRNYFDRASAALQEEEDMMDEREDILEDLAQLKKLAQDYLQPERPVVVDALATCRNYFDRSSAPETESWGDAKERAQILADAAALKKLAVDYLQPELPVVTSDPTACGSNYFDRPSVLETESCDDAEERAQILADAAALKKLAVDYLHPELPVVTSDPTACGRNYFDRASADGHDDMISDHSHQWYDPPTEVPTLFSYIMAKEQAEVLADATALKQLAVDYLHPERPLKSTGAGATGRNYFDRASATLQEEEDIMDEREDILADMAQLKKLAQDYLQPERPIVVDTLATCRNYFDRLSAPTLESVEEAEERAQILADAAALKKLAVDYLHPELPVVTSDPAACGRNYFDRASADGHDDMIVEDLHQWYDPPTEVPTLFSYIMAKEQAQVLADAAALKRLAVDYLHPERPVKSTGGGAMGRNYFDRVSAEECEMDMEERDAILHEMAQLKQLAIDYLHPELPVKTTDGCATGRNYFSRSSAPEQVAPEDAEEGGKIVQEMALMKQVAEDYLCPEKPVVSNGYGARCYFDRASEASHLDHILFRQDVSKDDNVYGYHDRVLDLVHNGEESHHGHSDHFEMEMDDLETFRDNLRGTPIFSAPQPEEKGKMTKGVSAEEDEEGGNLSRSPSSVMLFELAGC